MERRIAELEQTTTRADITTTAAKYGLDPIELEAEAWRLVRIRENCADEVEFLQQMAEESGMTADELRASLET